MAVGLQRHLGGKRDTVECGDTSLKFRAAGNAGSVDGEVLASGVAIALGLASLKLRLSKLIARFLPATCASAGLTLAIRAACAGDRPSLFVGSLGTLLVAGGLLVYRKRGPDRRACENCPERLSTKACSGLAPMLRRERAFQRLSQRWIDAALK